MARNAPETSQRTPGIPISQFPKMRENVERTNKTREWGVCPKSWGNLFSGYRIFPDLSLSESQSSCLSLETLQFSTNSTERAQSYGRFSKILDQICWGPSVSRFALRTIILLYENEDLVRAVNRQPCLPRGMTRRAHDLQLVSGDVR